MNPGTCIHYNGFIGRFGEPEPRRCDAGVCYSEAFGSEPGLMTRAPCIAYLVQTANGSTLGKPGDTLFQRPSRLPRAPQPIPCGRRVEPTDEQVREHQEESEAYFQKTVAALEVAAAWRVKPKPKQARNEVVECPVCKGRLHLSQSAYNGHVHGKCETPKCVEWME